MAKEPLFLGRAKKIEMDETKDGEFVWFRLVVPESPELSPVEFVVSIPLAMQLLAAMQDLQGKRDWKIPKGKVQ